jgi:hypothetical protein
MVKSNDRKLGCHGDLMMINGDLPSGKLSQFANWKITIRKIGQSTMNGPFSIAMLNYQRVSHVKNMLKFFMSISCSVSVEDFLSQVMRLCLKIVYPKSFGQSSFSHYEPFMGSLIPGLQMHSYNGHILVGYIYIIHLKNHHYRW